MDKQFITIGKQSHMQMIVRSSHRRCYVKKVFLKFLKFHWKAPEACNFIEKDTPTQVFSSKIYEIFKNTYFWRTSANDYIWIVLHSTATETWGN